jgi:GntR family transcriptional regulator
MTSALEAALGGALPIQPGIPLRVAVYTRIAAAIRAGALRPGSLVPTESELGLLMGVSRTVVREAVMLLEEDGLVRSRRGVGRFVADRVPHTGLERLRPLEEVLTDAGGEADAGGIVLRRTERSLQPSAAPFVAEGLGIGADDPSWFTESVLLREGEPIALLQEHLPGGERLAGFGDTVRRIVTDDPHPERSIFAALLEALGPVFGPAESEIALGVPGTSRAALLGIGADDPVIVITQTMELAGRPFSISKQLLTPRAGTLALRHTTQP